MAPRPDMGGGGGPSGAGSARSLLPRSSRPSILSRARSMSSRLEYSRMPSSGRVGSTSAKEICPHSRPMSLRSCQLVLGGKFEMMTRWLPVDVAWEQRKSVS